MKSLFSNLFVVSLFVCLSVQYASGLKCYVYQCGKNYYQPPYYYQPCMKLNSSMIEECVGYKDPICFVIRESQGSPNNFKLTYSCESTTPGSPKENIFGGNYKSCYTDLCNGTDGITTTKMILFISAVFSICIFMFEY